MASFAIGSAGNCEGYDMDAKGKTGTMTLSDGVVTIQRRGSVGWRASTGAVETRVPVSDIVAIQIKAATLIGNGAIRLVVISEDNARRSSEDTVVFTYRQNAAFTELAAAVASAIAARMRSVAC